MRSNVVTEQKLRPPGLDERVSDLTDKPRAVLRNISHLKGRCSPEGLQAAHTAKVVRPVAHMLTKPLSNETDEFPFLGPAEISFPQALRLLGRNQDPHVFP